MCLCIISWNKDLREKNEDVWTFNSIEQIIKQSK